MKVVIVMEGGLVQEVYAIESGPIENAVVVDFDIEAVDQEDLVTAELGDSKYTAFVSVQEIFGDDGFTQTPAEALIEAAERKAHAPRGS